MSCDTSMSCQIKTTVMAWSRLVIHSLVGLGDRQAASVKSTSGWMMDPIPIIPAITESRHGDMCMGLGDQ